MIELNLLLAVVCWGISPFFQKVGLRHCGAAEFFDSRLLFTFLMFAPTIIYRVFYLGQSTVPTSKLASVYVVLSVAISNLGSYFYIRALHASELSRIAPIGASYPLITLFAAMLFLGDAVSVSKVVGALLISIGVCLLSW